MSWTFTPWSYRPASAYICINHTSCLIKYYILLHSVSSRDYVQSWALFSVSLQSTSSSPLLAKLSLFVSTWVCPNLLPVILIFICHYLSCFNLLVNTWKSLSINSSLQLLIPLNLKKIWPIYRARPLINISLIIFNHQMPIFGHPIPPSCHGYIPMCGVFPSPTYSLIRSVLPVMFPLVFSSISSLSKSTQLLIASLSCN